MIPAKALPAAKSRLTSATADADAHRRLVEAIRSDTVGAALDARGVARVVLVVDRIAGVAPPPGVEVIVQRAPGLNAALDEAAGHAVRAWPGDGVAALVGDLPALHADELAEALRLAAAYPQAYVVDAAGTGTTLLTAAPGESLRPAFGLDSAARHAQVATPIPAGPGLRQDVDTADDLAVARGLGVGPATGRELVADGPALCSPARGIVGA